MLSPVVVLISPVVVVILASLWAVKLSLEYVAAGAVVESTGVDDVDFDADLAIAVVGVSVHGVVVASVGPAVWGQVTTVAWLGKKC